MNWHFPGISDVLHFPDLSVLSRLFNPSKVPITDGDLIHRQIGTDDVLAGASNSTNLFFGDAGGNILDRAVGGDDTFTAGANSQNIFYGDAVGTLFDHAVGGNDTFSAAAAFEINTFYGDAGKNISDHARGGDDTFIVAATSASSDTFYGDAGGDMSCDAAGGNDTFRGSASSMNLVFYGDAGGNMSGNVRGGNDSCTDSGNALHNVFYGDAGGNMSGHAAGGDDSLTTNGSRSGNFFWGDAGGDMSDHAVGGNDTFQTSGINPFNVFYGDAGGNMFGSARGGNDIFNDTSLAATNTFYGDAGGDMSDHAVGGDDTFAGGANSASKFYGDAGGNMGDHAVGGDDTFTGGANSLGGNLAYGDALTMSGNAHGGNDTLVGGDNAPRPAGTYTNILIGDAQTMSGNAVGGNDQLISGTGNDDMWGDAQAMLGNAQGGRDTFVYSFNNGHDKIEDFGQGDRINVVALGIHNFGQLSVSAFDPVAHESTIAFSPGNDVIVHSQIALTSHDFLFADISDMLWRGSDGTLALWDINSSGAIGGSGFLNAGGIQVKPDASWSIVADSDFSGDGRADLVWRNTAGATALWTMNGASITSSSQFSSGGIPVNPDPTWSVAGAGDFNGDGMSDLLWHNSAGQLVLWTLNGSTITGSGLVTSGGNPVNPDPSWSIAGVGDLDGDGMSDLVWRNSATNQVTAWFMNGSSISGSGDLSAGGVAAKPDASWGVAGVGDFNADGAADLLWRKSDGTLAMWLMNGSSIDRSNFVTSGGLPVSPDAAWHVVEIGDFNGDARSDILWRNDSGVTAEWLMKGATITSSVTPSSGGNPVNPDPTWSVQAKPTNFA